MAKFVKKPVIVEAIQWVEGEDSKKELEEFIKCEYKFLWQNPPFMKIKTLEDTADSWHYASLGDWIIRGVENEFYACKPEIFEKTYELMQVKQDKYKLL